MDAAEVFKRQMQIAELRERFQAEADRMGPVLDRIIEKMPELAPCRELGELMEAVKQWLVRRTNRIEEQATAIYEEFGDAYLFNED